MNISLDKISNTIEQPNVWLCHRNYKKICTLSPIADLKIYVAANSCDEVTFTFHKENSGEIFPYWEELKNLKIIYIENFGYFEIAVDKDDKEDTVKTITGISIEAELAQIILRNLSINGEYDLNKDDNFTIENGKTSYKPTVLYAENDTSHSLIHRVLSKAPHWSIGHIDSQITENDRKVFTSTVERKFEFDNISIYDALQEIAEELDLVFTFDTTNRLVNMYDLNSIGNDTTIYVNKENLTNQFTCSSNKDSIKNRFKIVGGDDIMTSFVSMVNPNGTQYIDFYSDDQKADMSKELVDKLNAYDELYETNREAYQEASVTLCEKIDKLNQLRYSLAPTISKTSTTADAELQKLTASNIGNVPVSKIAELYKRGADKAVTTVAQILVDYRYTVTIESSTYDSSTQKWSGTFKVINESNESDLAKSATEVVLSIVEDEKEDLQNKINKIIGDANFEDESLEELKKILKKYSLSHLETYQAMYKECTNILLEQGYGVKASKLYDLYYAYWQKQKACEDEIAIRKSEIETVEKELDSAQKAVNDYHQLLNFENFVGETLFKELSCYIREDTYENNNYISDGLRDAECIENAKKLVEAATKELYKASTFQYSYTASLNNLFNNLDFEPFYNQFNLFNWIHAEVDEKHILLRLIGVTFDFANITQIEVEFSEQVRNANGLTDIESILSQAKSMATSYSSTAKQAAQGSQSYTDFKTLKEEGLNSALMNIKNSNNEEVVIDNCGINCRSKDVNDEYDGCQLRITGKNLVMTDDDWETAKLAIGQGMFDGVMKYGVWCDVLVGDIIVGQTLMISNENKTFIVDKDGIIISNMKLDMYSEDKKHRILIDPALKSIFNIYNEKEQVFFIDQNGNVSMYGNLYVTNNGMYCNIDMSSDNIIEIGVGEGSKYEQYKKEWYRSYDGISIGQNSNWVMKDTDIGDSFDFTQQKVTKKNGEIYLLNGNLQQLQKYIPNSFTWIEEVSYYTLFGNPLNYTTQVFVNNNIFDDVLYILYLYNNINYLIKYNLLEKTVNKTQISNTFFYSSGDVLNSFIYDNKIFVSKPRRYSDDTCVYIDLSESNLSAKTWIEGTVNERIIESQVTENGIYVILQNYADKSIKLAKLNDVENYSYDILYRYEFIGNTVDRYVNIAHMSVSDDILHILIIGNEPYIYQTMDLSTENLKEHDVPSCYTIFYQGYYGYVYRTNGCFSFCYEDKLHLFVPNWYAENTKYTRYGNTYCFAMTHYVMEENRYILTSKNFKEIENEQIKNVYASFQGDYIYKNRYIYALESNETYNSIKIKRLNVDSLDNGWEIFKEVNNVTNIGYTYFVNSDSDRLYLFGYYTNDCYCINLEDDTKTLYKLSQNSTHIAPGTCSFVDEKNNFIYWGGVSTMFYNPNAQIEHNENGFVTGFNNSQHSSSLIFTFLSNFVNDDEYIYVVGCAYVEDIKLYRIGRGSTYCQEIATLKKERYWNAASYTICLMNKKIFLFTALRGVLTNERIVYDIQKKEITTHNDMFEDLGGYLKLLEYLNGNVGGDSQSRTTSMPIVSTDVGIFFFTQYPYSKTQYQDMPAYKVYLYNGIEHDSDYEVDVDNPLDKKIFYIDNKGNGYFYGTIYAKDGVFKGDIIARSLTLGSDVSIDTSYIGGLNDKLGELGNGIDDVSNEISITNGIVDDLNYKYNDISENFGNAINEINQDLTKVIYKDDITITNEDIGDGVIKTTTTVPLIGGGYSENVTYTSKDGDYVITNVGIGDESGHFVKISKEGLLQAINAEIKGTVYATEGAFGGWIINQNGVFSVDFDTSDTGIKMLKEGQIITKGIGGGWVIDGTGIYNIAFYTSSSGARLLNDGNIFSKGIKFYTSASYAMLDSGKWIFGLGDSYNPDSNERYSDLSVDGLYITSKASIENNLARYLLAVNAVDDFVKITNNSTNPALSVTNFGQGTCLEVINNSYTYDNKCLSLGVSTLNPDPEVGLEIGYINIFGEGEGGSGRIILRPDRNIKSTDTENPANFTNSACGTFYYPWGTMSCEKLYVDKVAVTSDAKVKTSIKLIDKETALEFINSLIPREYYYKKSENKRVHMGFYAQEVNQVAKDMNLGDMAIYEAILSKDGDEIEYKFDESADDEHLHWILNYNEFIAPLVSSVQELTRRDKENRKRINDLTEIVTSLLDEIKQLKNELNDIKGTK